MESMQPTNGAKYRIAFILCLIVGVIALSVVGYLMWNIQKTNEQHENDVQALHQKNRAEVDALNTRRTAVEDSLNKLRQMEIDSVKAVSDRTMKRMAEEHAKDIKAKQAQIFQILRNGAIVDGQLDTLRRKIIASNELTQTELNSVNGIVEGLQFLAEEYKKPIEQFQELEKYVLSGLEKEDLVVPPSQRFALLKRMFSSTYNQQLADYYTSTGRRDVFIKTRDKIQEAYHAAQKQMAEANEKMSRAIQAISKTGKSSEAGITDAVNAIDAARQVLNVHKAFTTKPDEINSEVKAISVRKKPEVPHK